ncbi:MAG: InlB B-repeat-containing protein, partial [Prevotellaceae bacterium]|nr:InlB B-repeat-containing protein [Prevotellaceae bacterium]
SYEVVAPVAPTKDDFEFAGWYTDAELTIPATFPVTVTTNTVFYAKWQIPTGVNTVNADNGLSISNIANGINIEAKTAAHVQIFSVIGQLIGTRNLAAGESTFVTLPKGIYVVNGQKVVVK